MEELDPSISRKDAAVFHSLLSVSSGISLSLLCLPGKLLEEGRRGKKDATP